MTSLQPEHIVMSEWNIVIIDYNNQIIEKFLGYSHEWDNYRISSQIQDYDPENKTGRTLSGSTYQFLDNPGQLHPKAQAIFDALSCTPGVIVKLKF